MKLKIPAYIIAALSLIYLAFIVAYQLKYPQLTWDWDRIDTGRMNFPENFLWGVATAAHQVEGNNTNNQWYAWEHALDESGNPRVEKGAKSGLACDHWNRYPTDIGLMKELGVKAYRFSVEWSRIEPRQGFFDTAAIRHYQDVCDSLLKHNIKPVVTLHHFTNPIWFEELGAFEKSENVKYFTAFVEEIFPALQDRVDLWCTINEPAVYTVDGYFTTLSPPGKTNTALAAVVLRNLLEAHVQAYHTIKSLPGGEDAKVGMVKNMTQFDPYNKWNMGDWFVASTVYKIFNSSIIGFLKTGNYEFNMPFEVKMNEYNPDAINTLDFIGLNYYSHYYYKFSFDQEALFDPHYKKDDIMTDMDYAFYPEGFYRAVRTLSQFGVPIFVTENGIADAKDDRRALFIQRYLYALSEAIKEGYDLKGYFYWSLMDNFEWSFGFEKEFGLYSVDRDTQERTLKKGASQYQRIIREFSK
jgi:beta-glucosidase